MSEEIINKAWSAWERLSAISYIWDQPEPKDDEED